jgi:hypothetical protein
MSPAFMVLSILVRLLAFALIFEAMFAGLYVANALAQLGIYDTVAVSLIIARGLLGAVQFAGGWILATGRPQGVVLAQWGLAGGAIVTILGVGFNLAPTSIYHWLRWHATAVYVAYAIAAIAILRRSAHS